MPEADPSGMALVARVLSDEPGFVFRWNWARWLRPTRGPVAAAGTVPEHILASGPLTCVAGGGQNIGPLPSTLPDARSTNGFAMAGHDKVRLVVRGNDPGGRDVVEIIRASGARVLTPLKRERSYLVEIPRARADVLLGREDATVRRVTQLRPATSDGRDPAPPPPGVITRPNARLNFRVVSAKDPSTGIPGAGVKYFVGGPNKWGVTGRTNGRGEVGLVIGKENDWPQKVLVTPPPGYWGRLIRGELFRNKEKKVALDHIDINEMDGLRFRCRDVGGGDGSGVVVGVVDSGVGPHPDLDVAGGCNLVQHEPDDGYHDCGLGHGTHVAGIIASRSTAAGARGIAPGVTLRSYRVFPEGGSLADSYLIADAVDRAVQDGCHLINLSMSDRDRNPDIEEAIAGAHEAGCLVVAAAGNDYRKTAAFPGASSEALCVASCGLRGFYPAGSSELDEEAEPYCRDALYYIAASSNVGGDGTAIDLIGPGVGVISTAPGGGYAVQRGTSMACAAVTAFAARLLSAAEGESLGRGGDRARRVKERVLDKARAIFNSPLYEGFGCI